MKAEKIIRVMFTPETIKILVPALVKAIHGQRLLLSDLKALIEFESTLSYSSSMNDVKPEKTLL